MSETVFIVEYFSVVLGRWCEWSRFNDRDTAWERYGQIYTTTHYPKVRMRLMTIELIVEETCPRYGEELA